MRSLSLCLVKCCTARCTLDSRSVLKAVTWPFSLENINELLHIAGPIAGELSACCIGPTGLCIPFGFQKHLRYKEALVPGKEC